MKVIYIAGPFRAAPVVSDLPNMWGAQENVMRAMRVALEVWRAGMVALCPHANTMFFTGAAPDEIWLEGDLELLRRCDALLLTPDWDTSSGARAERIVAEQHGIPVFTDLAALRAWAGQNP